MDLRIGNGYDVHLLAPGLEFWLGGIKIEHTKGCVAHSDGDTLIHALCDAMLGALALGDIGKHFPDSSDEFLGISSMNLLVRVRQIMQSHSAEIANVDATVIAQKPKFAPYIEKMRSNIAFALGCKESFINVKATTEERLGFTGREEGISVHAVVLLEIK